MITKRLLASVGLLALGATTLQAEYAPGLSAQERTKPWSISASLRGFYDDNYLTLSGPQARESFGLDFSPSFSINHVAENTVAKASYVYDLKHYDDGDSNDQTHQINATLDHAFSERYKMQLGESFVIGQEPSVLSPYGTATPLRLDGSNIRNTASADFQGDITQTLGIGLNYGNTLYSYDNDAYSSRLDRMEQSFGPDLRWRILQQTVGILGYRFGINDYNSSKDIVFNDGTTASSSVRNSYSHLVQVGADHKFTPELSGSVRVGAQFFDYYNSFNKDTTASPYADASLSYTYDTKGSWAQLGIKQIHNASDLVGESLQNSVLDEASTIPYLSITHKVTPKLTAGGMVQWQLSEISGTGSADSIKEDYLTLNLNLAYQFNPYLMAEAGYDFNNLSSDINRDYKRNIGYLGLRVTY
jgi:hypothetical protein